MPHRDNFDTSRRMQYISGKFFLNGSGTIDNTQNEGAAASFTATRSGVGTATVKVLVVAKKAPCIHFELSRSAIAARYLQVLGWTQGTDGMWTASLANTDMTGTAAQEWAAANAANFISFRGDLQLGDSAA